MWKLLLQYSIKLTNTFYKNLYFLFIKIMMSFLWYNTLIVTFINLLISTLDVTMKFYLKFIYIYLLRYYYNMKPSGVVASASDCHSTGPEFDFGLGNVHSTFNPFGRDKMSTEGPTLGWLPDRNMSCRAPQGPRSRKQDWAM